MQTEMAQATIEGRKTKTRRVKGLEKINEKPDEWNVYQGDFFVDKKGRLCQKFYINGGYSIHAVCPYGKVGDVLWVRETFKIDRYFNGLTEGLFLYFKTDYDGRPVDWNWTPSIHMPKAAARIWLEITEIKVERLQDITEEDAIAEGIRRQEIDDVLHYYFYRCNDIRDDSFIPDVKPLRGVLQSKSAAHLSFTSLWASINGWGSWTANPWVWVISFKVLSTTGKPKELC